MTLESDTTPPWDAAFEDLLRGAVEDLPAGPALHADFDLQAAGLNSMRMVVLLTHIEERYGLVFPDEYLALETFASPGTLWQALVTIGGTG
ncbi:MULTISPECIES: phosphopantetheine-binding protein [Kitasatospora]|uniref:phosphopantetheine-binding protein n=1 Tax=Kitasatospora TaxID=2063 RepID=UPI000C711317|nr:phosphopantetheine-binding protein [Kitasatospora sp. GP30]MDH6145168.1 acyl carrier protein [Kitasatospora sp. GP30]